MVQLWIASGILSVLGRPSIAQMPVSAHRSPPLRASNIPDHLADEALLGRLFRREATQQAQQPCLGGGVGLDFGLVVDFEQEEAQVAAAATLTRLQQQLGALG